jgi:hypothetical protein
MWFKAPKVKALPLCIKWHRLLFQKKLFESNFMHQTFSTFARFLKDTHLFLINKNQRHEGWKVL